jgi:hypothetical protein
VNGVHQSSNVACSISIRSAVPSRVPEQLLEVALARPGEERLALCLGIELVDDVPEEAQRPWSPA